jgi:glycosyltransferase involved in cell wall biosynthesis
MEQPHRILILPSWYPPDGGYFFKEHSEAIRDMGWEVDVLVNRVIGIRKLLKAGLKALRGREAHIEKGLRVIRSVYLKVPGSEKLNIRRWSNRTRRLYGKYEDEFGRPDLLLAHSATWAGYAAWLIRERYDIPYIVVEHRSFFVWNTPQARSLVKPYHIPFFEMAYKNCGKLVLVSGSLMTGLKELMPWIGMKTVVIPNMIREDMFLPPEQPRHADPFVFFWAGRLEHVKGIDLLMEAAGLLKQRTATSFLVRLAGRGPLRKALERQAKKVGVGDYVRFLGRITREELQVEMQRASCFVLPSRYEAFGAVLIEAMTTGLPVIATRSGGPGSIVTKESGLLVDPDDAEQLAAAMERMIATCSSYSATTIRARTMKRYGQGSVMKQYNRLFLQLLE